MDVRSKTKSGGPGNCKEERNGTGNCGIGFEISLSRTFFPFFFLLLELTYLILVLLRNTLLGTPNAWLLNLELCRLPSTVPEIRKNRKVTGQEGDFIKEKREREKRSRQNPKRPKCCGTQSIEIGHWRSLKGGTGAEIGITSQDGHLTFGEISRRRRATLSPGRRQESGGGLFR